MQSFNRVRKVNGSFLLESVIVEKEEIEDVVFIAKFSVNFFNAVSVERIANQLGFPITAAAEKAEKV
jgi:endonuclease V-like protein UPF0215 family